MIYLAIILGLAAAWFAYGNWLLTKQVNQQLDEIEDLEQEVEERENWYLANFNQLLLMSSQERAAWVEGRLTPDAFDNTDYITRH